MVKKLLLLTCLCMVTLTGCWDIGEVEERGFVIGTAIDLADNHDDKGTHELTLTNQFVVPLGLGGPGQSGGAGEKAYMNVSASGKSMFAIDRQMATLTSKKPYFEHLKILVISEEVAKIPHLFVDLLDAFIRPDMRRGIYLIAATGEAKEMLAINPEDEKLPSMYLAFMLENSLENTGELVLKNIGDIDEQHLNRSSYILPLATPEKTRITLNGGAVFNGHEERLVGTLDKNEIKALQLVTGESKGGTLEVLFKDILMTFAMEDIKSKITMNTKDPKNIKINVQIDIAGKLKEVFGSISLRKPENVNGVERELVNKVEKITSEVIEKTQNEFKSDVFDFDLHLKKHHYKFWKEIKDNWDSGENLFSKSEINVEANIIIRQAGISDQVNRKKDE